MSFPDFSSLILDKLGSEASLPVCSAITRFARALSSMHLPTISLSNSPCTLFTHADTFETSFNIWLALPIPGTPQLSQLRQALSEAQVAPQSILSLKVSYGHHQIYLPAYVVNLWPRLHTIIRHCKAWAAAQSALIRVAESEQAYAPLARDMLSRLSIVAADASIPGLLYFRTSHLSDLITDSWLSDEHINAGAQFINLSSQRLPSVYVFDTFWISQMRRNLERYGNSGLDRPSIPDSAVGSGSATELLIPVHQPSHWTLLYVNVTRQCYSFCDTLDPSETSAPGECIDLVNNWLSRILHSPITLVPEARPFELDYQTDTHSCGVAVLSTMACYALGHPFQPWSQATAKRHRLNWALWLSSTLLPLDLDSNHCSVIESSSPPPSSPDSTAVYDLSSSLGDSDSVLSLATGDTPSPSRAPTSKQYATHVKPQLRQTKLPFKPVSCDEWRAQEKRRYNDRKEEREQQMVLLERHKAQEEMERRQYERDRKRDQRERQKEARMLLMGNQTQEAGHALERSISGLTTRHRLSKLSRNHPYKAHTTDADTARQPDLMQRINWCHPLIWAIIERTAQEVGFPWSPAEIVRRLQQADPVLFAALRPQRISQWRDHQYPNELIWTKSHQRAIDAGSRVIKHGRRRGIFDNHPNVVHSICSCLTDLRRAGIRLNLRTIRGYMVGVIQHFIPDAFSRTDSAGRTFRCSDQFTRRFLRTKLGWSIRKVTQAAQKHPPDVNLVLRKAFLRFACVVRDEDIPSCCIVNADQTQVVYNPSDQRTWNAVGEQQIRVVGAEDKRAFTLLVAASNSGVLLPFQAIFTGKSPRSLPTSGAPGFSESQRLEIRYHYSDTDTYWSTFKTMKLWVKQILVPYFMSQRARHNLPVNQRCILQIDCWTVHRSARFLDWMAEKYPWIVILFVPGGCTGLFQACDVGLQRVLKLAISRRAHADVVVETVNALQSGTPPEQIINDQGIGTLRNRSINWMIEGFNAINKPDLIKKAFMLCAVPGTEFNLSYESLTSREARQAILELRTTDPKFYAEITSGRRSTPPAVGNYSDDSDTLLDGIDGLPDDGDVDHTVDEVASAVLNARDATEAMQPLQDEDEAEFEEEDPSDRQSSTPSSSTCAGRRIRISSRYCNIDWE